jgi:hypothetical protein
MCEAFLFLTHTNIIADSSFSSVDESIIRLSTPLTVFAHA